MRFQALPLLVLTAATALLGAGQGPVTGPATEKRFPPLKVPPGFKATLFACDPLVEYPSAVALGPHPGSLFVAADFLTGLGEQIVRRDEVRLLEDTDGDGYADKSTVFADRLNSIQGLAYADGTVYVMHAPYLTALRDTRGKGVADERRDLLSGLGLPPEQDPIRLHNANGVVVGHDGWLYLALGDHGCDVLRPEGDRLVLHGGGILRCRPDGRDLHVFATGLRNIYDVALDDDLNVFVRDNENDGGTYMIRVYHSFFGADHGYPYHYEERPDEALPPLADLGLGSSAGGLCYRERQFPPEYHGNLFFCEWGRAVVRYTPRRAGSSFARLSEVEFAAGADDDPYGFRPTDLITDRDGSLIVVDWADGQRPRRGRGRVYRISYVGKGVDKTPPRPAPQQAREWLGWFDSESACEREQAQEALLRLGREGRDAVLAALKEGLGVRGRLHAVWILARHGGATALEDLLAIARDDPEPRVQVQALRALADLADPVLIQHRLHAGPGDAALARRLAALAPGRDPRVMLEVVIALGRLCWPEAPVWLRRNLRSPDTALAHAAMQTLRRSGNWPALLELLDEPSTDPWRVIALRAISERTELPLVDGLLQRLQTETNAIRRRQYADALARVCKKPGSWHYWGFRPGPRPANTVAWERTDAITATLGCLLADPDQTTRLAVLRRMQREKIPAPLTALRQWLGEENQAEHVAAILDALHEQPPAEVRSLLVAVVRDRRHTAVNRLKALALLAQGLDAHSAGELLEVADTAEDGPVLAEVLRQLGKRPDLKLVPLLTRKLDAADAEVRAAAIEAMVELHAPEGQEASRRMLDDSDARVREAAAVAAGKLTLRPAVETLLKRASDPVAGVRRASLESLRRLGEARVLPLAVAAVSDRVTQAAALDCIAELGGPEQAAVLTDLAKHDPAAEVLSRVVDLLTKWSGKEGLPAGRQRELDAAIADIQGSTASLLRWQTTGPLPPREALPAIERISSAGLALESPLWQAIMATSGDGRVRFGTAKSAGDDSVWLAVTELAVAEPSAAEFQVRAACALTVWLNGKAIYEHAAGAPPPEDFDRITATLVQGSNRLLVRASAATAPEFRMRFRRQSPRAEHEKLARAALTRHGNRELGRKLFFDTEKSLCLKCHRIGDQGERIGPELTGIGSRFSRSYLIESILEPSRAIAPGFQTLTLTLKNGKVLSGIKVAEAEGTLTLADSQGQKLVLAREDIEESTPSRQSTMPEGLEKRFSESEFVDLIEFLAGQKGTGPR
jgi:putative membrane-bound dehydrogenase-like protein